MLLTDYIVQKIHNYDNLKTLKVFTEKVTNICYRITLVSMNVKICIDVEEQESYISFIIYQEKQGKTFLYYALSDYSTVAGERLPLFSSIKAEKDFNTCITQAIRNHRKLLAKDNKESGVADYVMAFLDSFIANLV